MEPKAAGELSKIYSLLPTPKLIYIPDQEYCRLEKICKLLAL